MGLSLPPPATLDLVGSYARRRGDVVELVLARSDLPSTSGPIVVRLTKGSSVVTGSAEVREAGEGSDVVGSVPVRSLTDGIWGIGLGGAGDDEFAPVTARLLVQGARPVVLLWGEQGTKSKAPDGRAASARRRVLETGSKALDTGLRLLPPQRADQVRAGVKKVARSVLR
jgi:hypothetical protein